MTPSASQIEERLPIWEALSDLFLDTELQPHDYEYVAKTLAASSYSEKELEEILLYEVYPVCEWNLLSVAGEWAGFDREWIKQNMTPRYGKRPIFRFGISHRWMITPYWETILPRIQALRNSG